MQRPDLTLPLPRLALLSLAPLRVGRISFVHPQPLGLQQRGPALRVVPPGPTPLPQAVPLALSPLAYQLKLLLMLGQHLADLSAQVQHELKRLLLAEPLAAEAHDAVRDLSQHGRLARSARRGGRPAERGQGARL